jgi:uncharacterized protein (TIGR02646 family)
MIHVTRTAAPALLAVNSSQRKKELAKILDYLNTIKAVTKLAKAVKKKSAKKKLSPKKVAVKKATAKKKPVLYSLYSEPVVKTALRDMFNDKCAYCDSFIMDVYIGDVEHFRPKAKVKEAIPPEPGYFWLAADWDNLLLSCRNCNQLAKHELDGITFNENDPALGKMNQFPLFDETKRVRNYKVDIGAEEPYRKLINPCVDNPENFFEYDEGRGIIKAKTGLSAKDKEMAEASISVYVLHRSILVKQRHERIIEIKNQKQRVSDLLKDLDDFAGDPIRLAITEGRLQNEINILQGILDSKKEYLGLARQMVSEFLSEVKRRRA